MHKDTCHNDHCVCQTFRKIVHAQQKVSQNKTTGCEQSIAQLRSHKKRDDQSHTTVPFILYCKDCRPFIAEAVYKRPIEDYPDETYYDVLCTPFLKAKKFIGQQRCCLQVELLCPVNANGYSVATDGNRLSDFMCDDTPFKTIQFRETGICLTLDLDHFSAVQCLDATTPLPPFKHKYHSHH
ncbi:CotY/CotZ family spore coat protein [Lentibacillus saliphilus]|uniref:CotY/CotZ family spore coat protein n=1 Tax=Lentibacillus saliphilus TaxID=2737028 RepID=UPI001FE3606A|nr:CotY/CotZ family spore coat protein [Lentibacillus saliphilus]